MPRRRLPSALLLSTALLLAALGGACRETGPARGEGAPDEALAGEGAILAIGADAAPSAPVALPGDPLAVAGPDGRRGGFRLADADSPYLRQHADNAVTWFPWGDEAFALAQALQRPVFLSIGYSACHWCHVMEHESFEHQETADLLDGYFVSIKVDREQRPDVDARYMRAVQAMAGAGGWPLTAFLTPEGEPFYGGTYFPLESQGGLPSFRDLLMNIADAWSLHRDDLLASVAANQPVLSADVMPPPGEDPGLPGLRSAADLLARALDPVMGGYGGGPQKFPPHQGLSFALRRMARGQPLDPAGIVATLDAMASRGLRDHVGGGFHRYCVDPEWLVPHFEKMLYDNGQLAEVYALASVVLDQPRHGDVARDLLRWLRTDMRSPEGLYFAARDADSLPFDADGQPTPGARREEGWVTTWTPDEVRAVLGPADGDAFCRLYGVNETGNFEDGRSIPRPMVTEQELAADPGQGLPQGAAFVAWNRGVLAMLRQARADRPQAFRDEKLLTGWNGLALSGFAAAARYLDDPELIDDTRALGIALVEGMVHRDADGALRLWHQRFEGRPSGEGDLADHAYLARGLLDAYGATGEPTFLATAWELGQAMITRFGDEQRGGLFAYPGNDPRLPGTDRQLQDGARPAAQGVALAVLSRLAPLDDSGEMRAFVDRAMTSLAPLVPRNPRAFTSLALAVDHHIAPVAEVVLRGKPGDPAYDALLSEARGTVLPAELLIADAASAAQALAAVGVAETPSLLDGRTGDRPATAWLCTFGVCQEPATSAEQLAAQWDVVRVP